MPRTEVRSDEAVVGAEVVGPPALGVWVVWFVRAVGCWALVVWAMVSPFPATIPAKTVLLGNGEIKGISA